MQRFRGDWRLGRVSNAEGWDGIGRTEKQARVAVDQRKAMAAVEVQEVSQPQ